MELKKIYSEGEEAFLQQNSEFHEQIVIMIKRSFINASRRLNEYEMIEESNVYEKVKDATSNFYEILHAITFKPFDSHLQALDIWRRMDFKNLITISVSLNNHNYNRYATQILKELFIRKTSSQTVLDLNKTLSDFEDFLFYDAIYRKATSFSWLLVENWKLKEYNIYPEEPLLCIGHVLLKDITQQHLTSQTEITNKLEVFKQLYVASFNGRAPFDNFPVGSRVTYDAFIMLDLFELSRDEFTTRLSELFVEQSTVERITLDLSAQNIATNAFGSILFLLRKHYCSNYSHSDFREWVQKNFVIIKKNGEAFQMDDNSSLNDIIARHSNASDKRNNLDNARTFIQNSIN